MTSMDRRPHVPVAEFLYRHEAEFAAGFLRDAGIPFRLQIDDAGGADAGVTIARPAVLWVRAVDAERARELLSEDDLLEREVLGHVQELSRPEEAGAPTHALSPEGEGDAPVSGLDAMLVPLCRVERVVAGILALALFGLASYGGAGAVPWVGVWEAGALVGALVLGLSAVSGQTLSAIRAILRGLSGTAP
jgi:hypothetical protein